MATLRIEPPLLWTAATVLPVVCTGVVGARFVARNAQKNALGLDDWLALPALILVWGMGITIMISTAQGATGYPTPKVAADETLTTISPQQVITEKAYAAISLLQTPTLTFTKLSIMLFYLRIFGLGSRRLVRYSIYVANALIITWGVSFFFSWLFICHTHVEFLWGPTADFLQCPVNAVNVDLSQSISDVIMDVFIMAFPVPLILGLQMSTAKKVAVLGIFVIGALALAFSILRMAILIQELDVLVLANADEDFVSTNALYFMFLEAGTALIAICLPSIAGIFKIRALQNLLGGIRSYFVSLSAGGSRRRMGSGEATNPNRGTWVNIAKSATPSETSRGSRTQLREPGIELDEQIPSNKIMVSNTIEQHVESV